MNSDLSRRFVISVCANGTCHCLAWQPIDDADRVHAANIRHAAPGTLALPPSMRGTIGPGRGFRHVLGGGK